MRCYFEWLFIFVGYGVDDEIPVAPDPAIGDGEGAYVVANVPVIQSHDVVNAQQQVICVEYDHIIYTHIAQPVVPPTPVTVATDFDVVVIDHESEQFAFKVQNTVWVDVDEQHVPAHITDRLERVAQSQLQLVRVQSLHGGG